MRNPKSSYLQGESLFLHIDEGCCIYSVLLQQIPEDETILCMETFISNVLLHCFICFQSSENRHVCVCYVRMYIEIIFFSRKIPLSSSDARGHTVVGSSLILK